MVILEPIKSKNYSVPRPGGVWLLGVLLSMTGIVLMGVGGFTTLTCHRQASLMADTTSDGVCKLTTYRPLASTTQEIALTDLHEAKLAQLHRHHYHVGYQVVLLTHAGEIPLTSSSPTQRDWKTEVTEDINRFLQTPERVKLQLQLENQSWAGTFGFSLAVIGTGAGLFAKQLKALQPSTGTTQQK
ncbi:hypothetical protein H6F88_03790 [Oculatella sp. FACHB-28]|uniref:hypothetical protein n=1 Tax=Oculatella sp. FACHB-28 TaxID=2692845 RepID=UPI001686313C|nr:hypothetical protein [Oculatella sp. FACHB-28]MBD1870119.1 hypothetical protein [Cyanobacteria bacterium FACHB-471]MBD2055152.1 hypothetical protein [Oculatella sp. FACHB-28]